MNYKAPLIKSLEEADFDTLEYGTYSRITFTHLRKNGQRRVKLWFGDDVWDASQHRQELLEQRLKANYGNAYLGGYFIPGPRYQGKSFCVVLDQSKLDA